MVPQRTSSASRWGKTPETDAFPTEFSHLGFGVNHHRADREPMRLDGGAQLTGRRIARDNRIGMSEWSIEGVEHLFIGNAEGGPFLRLAAGRSGARPFRL